MARTPRSARISAPDPLTAIDHTLIDAIPPSAAETPAPVELPVSAEALAAIRPVIDRASLVPIPDRLQRRPRHGALPIPFTTLMRDGKPDFRVNDPALAATAMKSNRCAMCGGILDYWKVFLGSAQQLDGHRLFTDPPSHQECMDYAIQVCPFLLGRPRRDTQIPGEVLVEFSTPYAPVLPDIVYLGYTRSYEVVYRRSVYYVHAAPFHHREELHPYQGEVQ